MEPSIIIEGKPYFSLKLAAESAGVSRQTITTWRRAGKVPKGSVFFGWRVLYTAEEMALVLKHAKRSWLFGGAA